MEFLQFAGDILPKLLSATVTTLELTAGAMLLGLVVGLSLALGRVYGIRPVRWLTSGYIQFFRGTPLLVQLLIVYYGLSPYLRMIGITRLPALVAAIVALGLNSAAYQAEYFRGAIQAVRSGQMMAARSIGMSRVQSIVHVVLPQALRLVIPSWSNELIYSIKYSSLAYFISLSELTFEGKKAALSSARTFEAYLVVAAIYLVIVVAVSRLLSVLESRVRVPGLGASHERR